MTLRQFNEGDLLSAQQLNQIIDALNNQRIEYDEAFEFTEIQLFVVSSEWTLPDLETASETVIDQEPTPYAQAKMLGLSQHNPDDYDPISGDKIYSYDDDGEDGTFTIYHPLSIRNSNGYAIGYPMPNDRVWCFLSENSGRWEVFGQTMGTGGMCVSFWAKAYEDWTNQTHPAMPYVNVQVSTRLGSVSSSTQYKVYLPRPTGNCDPAIYQNDVIAVQVIGGDLVCASDYFGPKLGTVWEMHNESALAPTGWIECLGAVLPGDKKVVATNAPDKRERVTMGRNPGGRTDENNVGDIGGFRWHGETENPHGDHSNHEHRLKMTSFDLTTADRNLDAATIPVWDASNPSKSPEVTGVRFEADFPANDDLLNHYGTIDNDGYRDTDNRMKYEASQFWFRYK